jgi:hypothetical protein
MKTLPYCLLNLAIAVLVQWLYDKKGVDLSISGTSHGFMSTMIGFLLVTRVSMAYQRYLDLRGYLENMTRQTRELVQNMVILTKRFQNSEDKSWRLETANRTLLLLRAVMAIVDYGDDRIPAWGMGINQSHLLHAACRLHLLVSRLFRHCRATARGRERNKRQPLSTLRQAAWMVSAQANRNGRIDESPNDPRL